MDCQTAIKRRQAQGAGKAGNGANDEIRARR
jgi:hypothetical protein